MTEVVERTPAATWWGNDFEEDSVVVVHQPPQKRQKLDKAGKAYEWLQALVGEGLYQPDGAPTCTCDSPNVCASTGEFAWVCISCGAVLSQYPGLVDTDNTDDTGGASSGRKRSFASAFMDGGSSKLAATAAKVDGTREMRRYLRVLDLMQELLKHPVLAQLATNQAVVRQARDLVRRFVLERETGTEKRQTTTWRKVAMQCLLLSAARNELQFRDSDIQLVLREETDTDNLARTLLQVRNEITKALDIKPVSWARRACGFVHLHAPIAVAEEKQRTAARRLISWFGSQPDDPVLLDEAKKPGIKGVKQVDALRTTASNLLLKLPEDFKDTDEVKRCVHAEHFAFLACWLVCDRVKKPAFISKQKLAHIKRVFVVYARRVLSCK
jgi:hypothetical protein